MNKVYAVYDTKNQEECIGVFDKVQDIAEYFNMTKGSILSDISKKNKIKHRYEIIRINNIDEDTPEIINKKSNEEIFRELINTFKTERVKFEIFDSFKWELKGVKDKVIIDEEWKQIEKFHYSLSNYGRVRNDITGKIKNPRFHNWILQVDIYENGKRYTVNIKRAVANYFIREVLKDEKVISIDGDIRNNFYKNLKIVKK